MGKDGTVVHAVGLRLWGRARRASGAVRATLLRGPCGLPCGARARRGLAKLALRAQTTPALIRPALRSSATHKGSPGPHRWPGLGNWLQWLRVNTLISLARGFLLFLWERTVYILRGLDENFTPGKFPESLTRFRHLNQIWPRYVTL